MKSNSSGEPVQLSSIANLHHMFHTHHELYCSLQVENIFSYDKTSQQYKLSFQEHGVAYGESNASDLLVEMQAKLTGLADFDLVFSPGNVTAWGLNYAGVVKVHHHGCETERVIYVPGTRTYDPAGMSGVEEFGVCKCMPDYKWP